MKPGRHSVRNAAHRGDEPQSVPPKPGISSTTVGAPAKRRKWRVAALEPQGGAAPRERRRSSEAEEVVGLSDGTTIRIRQPRGMDKSLWLEVRALVLGNMKFAKDLQRFEPSPEDMAVWLQNFGKQLALDRAEGEEANCFFVVRGRVGRVMMS